jgi:ribosomal protein L16 Arg81 hydroxylase
VLHAGDTLYVPAYTVHRVTGVSWSVSLSLGLRAFNEIDVVEHLLERLRMSSYLKYPPFAGAPESLESDHAAAKLDLMQRVRTMLQQMEGLAVAFLLTPLRLPPALDASSRSTEPQSAPDGSSTAVALREEANS